jgi:acyl phosphate:glycerol-3-phosphate acyltransferase
MVPLAIIAVVLSYLIGSIPFGLILTRLAGKGDIRDIGSGNIGATNVLRTGSKGLAAATLLLDAAKGALAVYLAERWWPQFELHAAAGVLIGHLYPLWLRFRGGKGVATLLGLLIPLLPIAALVYALVWLGLFLVSRISSLAGMVAALSAPVTAAVLGDTTKFPLLLGLAVLVVWKHRENIGRLIAGDEPRFGRSSG